MPPSFWTKSGIFGHSVCERNRDTSRLSLLQEPAQHHTKPAPKLGLRNYLQVFGLKDSLQFSVFLDFFASQALLLLHTKYVKKVCMYNCRYLHVWSTKNVHVYRPACSSESLPNQNPVLPKIKFNHSKYCHYASVFEKIRVFLTLSRQNLCHSISFIAVKNNIEYHIQIC